MDMGGVTSMSVVFCLVLTFQSILMFHKFKKYINKDATSKVKANLNK